MNHNRRLSDVSIPRDTYSPMSIACCERILSSYFNRINSTEWCTLEYMYSITISNDRVLLPRMGAAPWTNELTNITVLCAIPWWRKVFYSQHCLNSPSVSKCSMRICINIGEEKKVLKYLVLTLANCHPLSLSAMMEITNTFSIFSCISVFIHHHILSISEGRSIVPLFNVYLFERYLFVTSKTFDGKMKTMDR